MPPQAAFPPNAPAAGSPRFPIRVAPQLAYRPFSPFDSKTSPSPSSDSSDSDDDTSGEMSSEMEWKGRGGTGEKQGLMEGEAEDDWEEVVVTSSGTRRRKLLYTLPPIILLAAVFATALASLLFSGRHTFNGKSLRKMSLESLANGTFAVERKSLDWLREAGDGVYSIRMDDGSIELVDVGKNSSRTLVKGDSVLDERGQKLNWNTFQVSSDLQYILFSAARLKQWRHSSHSNFYLHSLTSHETTPILPPLAIPHTAIAVFAPVGHDVTYVHGNDVYVKVGEEDVRVTGDGGPTTFNGVPDWVYEEEVFSSDSTVWWSPDGTKIAFLSFDEEKVMEYEFPIYNPSPFSPGASPYPTSTIMRYPKPGYANPLVTIQVFDLSTYASTPARPILSNSSTTISPRVLASLSTLTFSNPFPEDDVVITSVTWVGKDDLLVKATDRVASIERTARFKMSGEGGKVVGEVVREFDATVKDGGWVEPGQKIVGIESTHLLHSSSASLSAYYPPGYLDIVPNEAGFNHIAYFSPSSASEPVFLTSGEWEVEGGIEGIDMGRGIIYFIAANPSIQRHLYSVPLPSLDAFEKLKTGVERPEPTVLTNDKVTGYYTTSFSPFAGFYVLSYQGPDVPYQQLVKVGDDTFVDILTDNARLARVEAEYEKAEVVYKTVKTAHKIVLNVEELRPPGMDTSGRTKYPVLFQVYGGPASQKVSTTYTRDWHHYLATTHNYLIITVDPRGTGYKGRKFRMGVRGRLGMLEARDTVEAAKVYAELPYVDEGRLAVWGWSYGGYLSSKVIETNSSVFSLGMAVAPVTDWRQYDTIYTERYMSTPKLNPVGYQESGVVQMDGFKHADFALAHGSGDDNVHFANTAGFLDRLTSARVHGFRFRMFTDSDHSISTRGAYWELMTWLTEFLLEKFGEGGPGEEGKGNGRWRMGHVGHAD